MPNYLQIQIPEPCHEDWHAMTPDEKGRYCQACKKVVTDFSAMTDSQLALYFKKDDGNSCGRFNADQLERPFLIPKKRIPWLIYFLKISIPAFLFSLKSQAQDTVFVFKYTFNVVPKDKSQNAIPSNDTPYTFKGKVLSQTGEPVPFASVVITGTTIGVAADIDGNFELKVSGKDKTVSVSAVEFQVKQVILFRSEIPVIVSLVPFTPALSGSVGGIIVVRTSRKRSKNKIVTAQELEKENAITVYPNPASINSLVTIKWNFPVKHSQQVEIFNMAGALVQKESVLISKGSSESSFTLKLNAPGNYVIRVKDVKGKKGMVAQLLVQ